MIVVIAMTTLSIKKQIKSSDRPTNYNKTKFKTITFKNRGNWMNRVVNE